MKIKEIIKLAEKDKIHYVQVKYKNEEGLFTARIDDYGDDSLVLVVHLSQKKRTPDKDGVIDTKFNKDWEVVDILEIVWR